MKLNIEYIAGFFDGEGCISISARSGPRVIVVNTNLEILQAIQDFFDGHGKISKKKRYAKDVYRKECWSWFCHNRHSEFVLRLLRPHLRLKRFQADLALEYLQTMGEGSGSYGPSRPFPSGVWEKRAELASKCGVANKRGVPKCD